MNQVVQKIVTNRYALFALVLMANIAFVAILSAVLPIRYEENDDIIMAMIANGSYSGVPDYHLVYINVLYGYVLTLLYGWTSGIEWYTLSFMVLHILSMSFLSYCILTTPNRARWEKGLWLLALYVLWSRIVISLQFTTTAGFVCLAGCVLLMRERTSSRWLGVLLVVIAALIRFMAAGLVGLLMAPIIVYVLRFNWRRYIPIVVMLVLIVGCRAVNRYAYERDSEWRYYREYNQLRAQLNDNPNAYKLQPDQLPKEVDWIDYQLLLRFIPDPEQIDLKAIRQLSAVVGSVPLDEQLSNLHRMEKYAVEISILLALLVLMVLTTGNKTKYLFLIAYSLFVAALIVHVSMDGFLKYRVFICMLLPLLVTDFMLLPKTTGLKRRWGIGVVMVVLSGWYVWQIHNEVTIAKHNRYVWREQQLPVLSYVPNDAYVMTLGSAMRMEGANPWNIWALPYKKYTLGWLTWCPLHRHVGDSYRVLLRDDMYVFTSVEYHQPRTAIPRICEQIEKHYGVKTKIRPICHNSNYALIQIQVE